MKGAPTAPAGYTFHGWYYKEEVYLPGAEEPLRLSRKSWGLRLLQHVRDESHRFAQHYHHILRRKSVLGDD